MLKELTIAIQSFFEAHRFIRAHRLWRWIVVPGLVYSLLFVAGFYLFVNSSAWAVGAVSRRIGLEAWLQREGNVLLSFLFSMAGVMVQLMLFLFYFSLFKFLFLIVASPVFAYLSEKTASLLEGRDFPFSFRQLGKDIIRGVRLALRNSLWQSVYLLSLLFLSLLPVVGWVTPLAAVMVECYYYGFSMLDYSLERNRLSPAASIAFVGRHKGLAIGNGILFYALHALPVVGWVLAPAYAVVAATLSVHKVQEPQAVPRPQRVG